MFLLIRQLEPHVLLYFLIFFPSFDIGSKCPITHVSFKNLSHDSRNKLLSQSAKFRFEVVVHWRQLGLRSWRNHLWNYHAVVLLWMPIFYFSFLYEILKCKKNSDHNYFFFKDWITLGCGDKVKWFFWGYEYYPLETTERGWEWFIWFCYIQTYLPRQVKICEFSDMVETQMWKFYFLLQFV